MKDKRPSTGVLRSSAKYLLYSYFKDADGEPKLHLFYQIQRVVRRWIDEGYLGMQGWYWAVDAPNSGHRRAGRRERIYNGIAAAIGRRAHSGRSRPLQSKGSTRHIGFMTSKDLYATDPAKSHVNYVVCDSDWEAEFARAAEEHPRVLSLRQESGRSASKSRTRTDRRRGPICRTSLSSLTMGKGSRTIRCTWSSRSRAIAART